MSDSSVGVTLSREEYDKLSGDGVNLYYIDTQEQNLQFDEDGDTQLLDLHRGDVAEFTKIRNGDNLYMALVSRAAYHCKLHPQQDALREIVVSELAGSVDTDSVIVFAYERDNAKRSEVKERYETPFVNGQNGIGTGSEASVVLFARFSFEPRLRGKVIWFREPRRNSTLGTVALLVEESY